MPLYFTEMTLEIFYFSSDEGARKIIFRECHRDEIKALYNRLIPSFIFTTSHYSYVGPMLHEQHVKDD